MYLTEINITFFHSFLHFCVKFLHLFANHHQAEAFLEALIQRIDNLYTVPPYFAYGPPKYPISTPHWGPPRTPPGVPGDPPNGGGRPPTGDPPGTPPGTPGDPPYGPYGGGRPPTGTPPGPPIWGGVGPPLGGGPNGVLAGKYAQKRGFLTPFWPPNPLKMAIFMRLRSEKTHVSIRRELGAPLGNIWGNKGRKRTRKRPKNP